MTVFASRIYLTQHYLHRILRFPITPKGCESTCLHCWQDSDSCQSVRSTPLFAFSPKESGHFSLYAKKYYKSIAKYCGRPDTFPFLSRCKPHTSWRSQGWRFPKVHRLGFLRFSQAPCSRWHGEWVGWQTIALVLHSVAKYWPVRQNIAWYSSIWSSWPCDIVRMQNC